VPCSKDCTILPLSRPTPYLAGSVAAVTLNNPSDYRANGQCLVSTFHHSVAVLPLPFFRSYVATVGVAGEN